MICSPHYWRAAYFNLTCSAGVACTLSSKRHDYNPLSWRLGGVCAVENGTSLFGLPRFGLNAEALRLARALYDLALLWRGRRPPERVGDTAAEKRRAPAPSYKPMSRRGGICPWVSREPACTSDVTGSAARSTRC